MTKEGIKMLRGEKWKRVTFHKGKGFMYAISNYGRLVRYNKGKIENGFLLAGSRQQGYPIWRFSWYENGVRKNNSRLFHIMVANYFLPKPSKERCFIIHLDYNKENNKYTNLQWVNQKELTAHAGKNPAVKAAFKKRRETGNYSNSKLTIKKVIAIKKLLQKGNTLKSIAVKYGVSDMQIHRIKTNENWMDIRI